MSNTSRHLVYTLIWLTAFTIAVLLLAPRGFAAFYGMGLYAKVASILWVLGFAGLFFSWARIDAPAHGRSRRSAAVFAVLWPLFFLSAHVVYLFFTRGLRGGTRASIEFIGFLIAWFAFSRVLAMLFGAGA
jgi:hypothetical protein